MSEKQFGKGEVIFREGEIGDSLYHIIDGTVGIYASFGETDERLLTKLGKNRIFGEMAVIEAYPRSATAVAMGDVKLDEIQSGSVMEYFESQPDKITDLMKSLSGRLRELSDDYAEVSRTIKELNLEKEEKKDRSEGLMEKIRKFASVYKRNKKAGEVSVETKRKLEGKGLSEGFSTKVESYSEGTVIFRDGENGECMYDIHSGSVGIYKDYGTAKERQVTTLFANDFFGEMGLIEHCTRSGTAVVLEDDTTVEIIGEKDLEELFQKNPMKMEMILAHLSHRLRMLTNDYMSACGLLFKVADAEDKGQELSEEVKNEVKRYDSVYINL